MPNSSNIHTSRPHTFWEALGAMLTTPLGCGGGGDTASDSAFDDVAETSGLPADAATINDAAASDAITEADADYFADGADSYSSPCLNLPPEEMGIKINELLYNPEGSDAGLEWVELFNKSPNTRNIGGYTITNREASALATLPDWAMPPCSYLVVHFGHGTNDDTFINGAGHFFTGPATEPFDNSRDEVALYAGEPSAETIEDFVAYSDAGQIEGGHAFQHAKTAGIWQAGDFFDTVGMLQDPEFVRVIVAEGDPMGRDAYSTDTDTSKDWAALGGKDSFGATPAEVNYNPPVMMDVVPEIKAQEKKKWAFLVYMAADNNLEKFGFIELNNLEKIGSTDDMHVVAFVDFNAIDLNTKTKGIAETSARIHIKKGNDSGKLSSDVEIVSEANTGDKETFGGFLKWAKQRFPADHYYLVIWGHGGGWKGIASDASTVDILTMDELSSSLSEGPDIDIMAFMACMMAGIEVAYQIRNKVDYMIASQEVTWSGSWGSWAWEPIMKKISDDPDIEAEDLAKLTVVESAKAYKKFRPKWLTFSAINLGNPNFSKLVSEVSTFAEQLKEGMEDFGKNKTVHDKPEDNVQARLVKILGGDVDSFSKDPEGVFGNGYPDFRDLKHLAEKIRDDALIHDNWKERAQNVIDMFSGTVIENINSEYHSHANGLSIYWPRAHTKSEYSVISIPQPFSFDTPLATPYVDRRLYAPDTDPTALPDHPMKAAEKFMFADVTLWDEFVHRFYNPVADASCVRKDSADTSSSKCVGKVIDEDGDGIGDKPSVKLSAKGSSDSDGKLDKNYKLLKYFWDLDASKNTDDGDYDKDNDDGPDDDADDVKMETEFTCKKAGEVTVRLNVWDNHNKVDDETSGNHAGHYQTDDEFVVIDCQ